VLVLIVRRCLRTARVRHLQVQRGDGKNVLQSFCDDT
jgi:hypothetical protein